MNEIYRKATLSIRDTKNIKLEHQNKKKRKKEKLNTRTRT